MRLGIDILGIALGLALASHAAAEPTNTQTDSARQHYEAGVELARVGRYEEALQEFSVAYETSPHFAVLYNIGQAYIGLRRPVEALGALEQYLKEGDTAIAPDRAARVTKQIAAQRAEVAELRILVNVAGAAIEVDGKLAGQAPMLDPLRVTAGTHLVSVAAPDRPPLLRSITVGAGQSLDLAIELPRAPGATSDLSATPTATPLPARASRPSQGVEAAPNGTLRTTGYVLAGAGVALGGAALGHYLWNRSRYEHWQHEDAALAAEGDEGDPAGRQQANNELAASIDRAETVTVALAVAAGASVAAGATLIVLNLGGTSVQPTFAMDSGIRLGVRGAW